jgi:hypothetical protein
MGADPVGRPFYRFAFQTHHADKGHFSLLSESSIADARHPTMVEYGHPDPLAFEACAFDRHLARQGESEQRQTFLAYLVRDGLAEPFEVGRIHDFRTAEFTCLVVHVKSPFCLFSPFGALTNLRPEGKIKPHRLSIVIFFSFTPTVKFLKLACDPVGFAHDLEPRPIVGTAVRGEQEPIQLRFQLLFPLFTFVFFHMVWWVGSCL